MTPRHQALAMTALAVLTVSLGGCSDLSLGLGCSDILSGEKVGCPFVKNKTIEVTTITVGEDIDPDGYGVKIRQSHPEGGGASGTWGLLRMVSKYITLGAVATTVITQSNWET